MITGVHGGVREGQADRHDVSGEVVLPQARTGADDRGGDPALAGRGPVHRAAGATTCRTRAHSCRSSINPLVDWIWFGLRRAGARHGHRAAAGAHVRVRAVEAARGGDGRRRRRWRCCWRCSCAAPAAVTRSTSRARRRVPVVPRSPLEKQLQTEIICMCGTCGRQRLDECHVRHRGATCARSSPALVEVGEDARRDHPVLHHEVRQRGAAGRAASTRASTAWRGSSRTSSATTGIVIVGFAAVKWSRKSDESARGRAADRGRSRLEERLDDELRNLD